MIRLFLSLCAALVIIATFFCASLIIPAPVTLASLETIHGIPFPTLDQRTHIDEPLAHVDVYLNQPVLARTLELTLTYIPHNANNIAVGARENSFWLSYPQQSVYSSTDTSASNPNPITSTITIPLSDKLQESDRSIDIMFFTDPAVADWEIISLSARTNLSLPSTAELVDYIKSIVKRERAL